MAAVPYAKMLGQIHKNNIWANLNNKEQNGSSEKMEHVSKNKHMKNKEQTGGNMFTHSVQWTTLFCLITHEQPNSSDVTISPVGKFS